MNMESYASLFYGVVISKDTAKNLLKRFATDINLSDDEDIDNFRLLDISDLLEILGDHKGFKVIDLPNNEDIKFGIAIWENTTYDYEYVTKLKIPKDTSKLDEKWIKISSLLKLGSKKPSWHLITQIL